MIPNETINVFLRSVINLSVAQPGFAIRGKQYGAPRPIGAYASVDLLTDTSAGWEESGYTNNDLDPDVTETIRGARRIGYSINFFRQNAVDNCRHFRTFLARENIRQFFVEANLGLLTRSEVRDLTAALEDGFEERAQVDIFLSAVGSDADIVTAIETASLSGTFETRGLIFEIEAEI
jgi:hypothetical protein